MKHAVLLTVYNRPTAVLERTFEGLDRNDLTDTVVICVDDGSSTDYTQFCDRWSGRIPLEWIEVDTIADRPGTYNIDGCNNPAYAFNVAFDRACELRREAISILSSDVVIHEGAITYSLNRDLRKEVVVASIKDERTGNMYCSATRLWPLYWFATTLAPCITEMGAWDENFLCGIACEDNDFMARLFAGVGELLISDAITCLHQSHAPAAYADGNRGWHINRAYLLDKWGTTFEPFNNCKDPVRYRTMRPTPDSTRMIYSSDQGPE